MEADTRATKYVEMGIVPHGVTVANLGTTTPECNGIPIKWSKIEVHDEKQFLDWEERLRGILPKLQSPITFMPLGSVLSPLNNINERISEAWEKSKHTDTKKEADPN